jgi:dTDP-4-amino-4,6-dideoxygalactose transaminase
MKSLVPFPAVQPDSRPGYYKLGLQYDPRSGGLSRDRFVAALRAEGIAVDAGFRGLHKIHSTRRFRKSSDLNQASRVDENVIVLHHPVLLTGSEFDLQQIGMAADSVLRHAEEIGMLEIAAR